MATINTVKVDRRKGVADAYKQTRQVNTKVELLTRTLRNLKNNRVKIPEGKDWDRILTLAQLLDQEVNNLVSSLQAGTQLFTTLG
jgi:hypothetical protein